MSSHFSRRRFVASVLGSPILVPGLVSAVQNTRSFTSPDKRIKFDLLIDKGRLLYRVTFKANTVIEDSHPGIAVDGTDLCADCEIGRIGQFQINEGYPTRGVHSQAVNHCNGAKIALKHRQSGTAFALEIRVFDDGIAFRFVVPGNGKSRVPDEVTGFTFPRGSIAWFHDLEGHYEGIPTRQKMDDIQADAWAAPPVTVVLPGNLAYAAVTEAGLVNYAGMALQADGKRGFNAKLGHSHHVSYPFRLRYADDVERLKKPAPIYGAITTPWRVVIIAADLNTLVNCDIVNDLVPPPDKTIFPAGIKTEWLKPGRAVWKYLDGGENTLEEVKTFSKLAGELGFEYQVVEGFWSRWSEAEMREAVEFSRQQKVGLLLWKHSRDLRTPAQRKQFFSLCRQAGAVGAKIDFFDHEAKEIIDLYQTLLREAAENRLLLDFHGANKPAGEARTWPNEMTREGIYGLEHRRTEAWAPVNTVLPFTRMLAGHADYTPVHFGERRKETSWAHQIASAAIFTSPLLVYGAHPKSLLSNPAVDVIKSIPSTWDETLVLPMSEIGVMAAFARRKDSTWFVAIMNGAAPQTISVKPIFLGTGSHQGILVSDQLDEPAGVRIEKQTVNSSSSLPIQLRSGGGFVARFSL